MAFSFNLGICAEKSVKTPQYQRVIFGGRFLVCSSAGLLSDFFKRISAT
jgi:hypothetical protein